MQNTDKKIIFSINGSMGHCGVDEYTLILEKALKDSFDFIHIVRQNSDISKLIIKRNGNKFSEKIISNNLSNNINSKLILFAKNYFKAIKTIKNTCKKYKPNIVIIHTAAEYFLSIFIRLFCNAKIVLVRHNSFKLNLFPNYLFIKLADSIVAPSNFCADVIKNQFPKFSHKVKVIYNAIDNKDKVNENSESKNEEDTFNKGKILDDIKNEVKSKNRIILGFIGRITRQKGIELLIDAFCELIVLDKNTDYRLFIGGKFDTEEYQNYIEEKIRSKNLSNKIKFLGFIEDKQKFFNSIDICIIPSLTSVRETFGLVAIESFKYDKPVVGMASGALAEILSYGPAAPICYVEAPKNLAETILVLKDEKLREKYIFNGKILINTLFSFERFQSEYLKLLENIK